MLVLFLSISLNIEDIEVIIDNVIQAINLSKQLVTRRHQLAEFLHIYASLEFLIKTG